MLKEVQNENLTDSTCEIIIEVANSLLYTEYGSLKKLAVESTNQNAFYDITATETQKIAQASEKKILQTTHSIEGNQGMDLMGLSKFLFSKSNIAISFKTSSALKLNHPLCHYLINTSHYTCLQFNYQASSLEITAKNYSKYLQKGVRCVDISLIVNLFNYLNRMD